ncbi:MAG: hypothetical protein LBS55_02150, partial [Prevotellaceae bacterium]|nr:hypothetical protein [Prevotellaceae bacterium]
DVGDLWAQGASGDIMKCKTAKASGAAYAVGDWEKASKYTDDSAIQYLTDAIKDGSTEIAGGLVLTNLLFMKNLEGIIRAGISGMDDDAVAFFAHDNDAYNVAMAYLLGQSSVRPNFAVSKNGFLVANSGTIGNAKIMNGDLVLEGQESNVVITNRKTTDITFSGGVYNSTLGDLNLFNNNVSGPNGTYINTKSDTHTIHITEEGLYNVNYIFKALVELAISHINTSVVASITWSVKIYTKKGDTILQTLLNVSKTDTLIAETSWAAEAPRSGSVVANIPAGSDLVFEYSAYCYLSASLPAHNASCVFKILRDGTTPFVTASKINRLAYICSDGIIIAYDALNKFIVTNKNNRISIIANLPSQNNASSGELCVSSDGTVKVK